MTTTLTNEGMKRIEQLSRAYHFGYEEAISELNKVRAEAAKCAIYALFEGGNCPQYENGAGDGYIECGDALKFADEYYNRLLNADSHSDVDEVMDTSFFNSVLERFEKKSDSENLPVALFGETSSESEVNL